MNRGAAVVALVALSDLRTASADSCAPRAHVTGDPPAVASVASELGKLGVSVGEADPGCYAVEAAVEIDRGGKLAVAVRESGHSEGRVVSDAALAAVWIESWVHDQLDPWHSDAPAVKPRVVAAAPGATLPVADVTARTVPAKTVTVRPSFAVGYEESWTDDGRSWTGFDVAACAHLGKLCLGARGRYATQSFSTTLSGADRSDMSLLATASTEIAIGNMRIAPEIGLGVGRMTTVRKDGCKPVMPQCDPTTNDPACMPDGNTPDDPAGCDVSQVNSDGTLDIADGLRATTYTPRASLAVRVAVPLFAGVWLDGVAAATAAPFGHTDSFASKDSIMGIPPGDIAIPGEPVFGVSLAIGVRLEMPEHRR